MAETTFTFKLRGSEDEEVQFIVSHEPLTDFFLDVLPKDDRIIDLEVTKSEEVRLYPR